MRRRWTLPVLSALVLMASLAAGLTASATAGTHKAKPKAIRCKSLITPSLLIHEVAAETGTAPEVEELIPEEDPHYDERGPLVGITLRRCSQYFANEGFGNATAYGYFPDIMAPPFYWYAGTAVTTQEFNKIYDFESFNGTLGPESAISFTKKRIPSLGEGSRAFVRTNSEIDVDSNPSYQSDYGLYVLSKGKHGKPGNLLVLYAWPMSLDREEQIVKDLLAQHRF